MVQSTRYKNWSKCIPQLHAHRSRTATSLENNAQRAMCQNCFISAFFKKIYLTTLTFVWKISNEYGWVEHHKIAKIRFYVMACRYFTNKISTCYSSTSVLSGNYFGRPAHLIILNKISSSLNKDHKRGN